VPSDDDDDDDARIKRKCKRLSFIHHKISNMFRPMRPPLQEQKDGVKG
jgi:hypothetical protein